MNVRITPRGDPPQRTVLFSGIVRLIIVPPLLLLYDHDTPEAQPDTLRFEEIIDVCVDSDGGTDE